MEPVKPAEPAKPAPAAVTQIYGSVRQTMHKEVDKRTAIIRNESKFALSGCDLRLPSNRNYRFGARVLQPNEEVKVVLGLFRPDARPADPQFKADWAIMYCTEGRGYWKTTYDRR